MNGILTYIINSLGGQEKISDVCFVCQYSTNNTEHIESRSAQLAVIFNDSHETISDNRNVNLYFHSILSIAPKGCDPEMLLYPPEKEFHLPSLFVQHRDVFRLDADVVGQECKGSFKIGSIVYYPAKFGGILFLGLIAHKAYFLINQDIISFIHKLFSINYFIFTMRLLSYDKIGSNSVDDKQPCKVIITFVKDVEGIRLIRYQIHHIHIMNFCFCDMNVSRNLSYDIKQRVDLDATLVFPEVCPLEQAQAKAIVVESNA